MENAAKNVFISENDDIYSKKEIEFSKEKKINAEYWDIIDDKSRIFLEELASMVGIDVKAWADEDAIKEIVDVATRLIEERFDVKFPFVN